MNMENSRLQISVIRAFGSYNIMVNNDWVFLGFFFPLLVAESYHIVVRFQ